MNAIQRLGGPTVHLELKWLNATAFPKATDQRENMALRCQQQARVARVWAQRCDATAKVAWLFAYALGVKWIPAWFTQFQPIQLGWLFFFALLNGKIVEWARWYDEVSTLFSEAARALETPDKMCPLRVSLYL